MSGPRFPSALPLVQAPMAGVQDSALAIAVSQAGGVGSLPCAMLSSNALHEELESIKSAGVTSYNLNFFCHQSPKPDEPREARWRNALSRYFLEYEIDPVKIVAGPGRVPFSAATLELIEPYKPPIVSFHFGLPNRESVDTIRSWGGQLWSSATTADEASWLADNGATAVIAQGIEAGGHRGMFRTEDLSAQLETVPLLAAIRRTVAIPVIAAGGIASPEHIRKIIAAGAWAVQLGTAYLCCNEAKTSPLHRSLLQSPASPPTQVTNLLSGRPARGLPNRLMTELGPLSDIAPAFPLASNALAPLRAAAEARGKGDFSPLWCGTDTSGCRDRAAGEHTLWLAQQIIRA